MLQTKQIIWTSQISAGHTGLRAGIAGNLLHRNRIMSILQVLLPVQEVTFSLIKRGRGGMGEGGNGGYTFVAP